MRGLNWSLYNYSNMKSMLTVCGPFVEDVESEHIFMSLKNLICSLS